MLKKSFASIFLFCLASHSLANNVSTTQITITPLKPDEWAYEAATIRINQEPPIAINTGITLPVNLNDKLTLTVHAMNAQPRLSDSCQHLKIRSKGSHQLNFKLDNWLIDCVYN